MKNKYSLAIINGLVITVTLIITIIVRAGTKLEIGILLSYTSIGFIGFGYSLFLHKIKMLLAAKLFLIFSIISGLLFYTSMPKGSEGLSQIGAFLGWILFMGISIIMPIVIELIYRIIKRKINKYKNAIF